jgi:pimeloyl-ACP methyl ester carboxylesterase
MAKSFEKLYANAPADLRQRLHGFRSTHPKRTVQHGATSWSYICGGSGEETILFVGGVGTDEESHFLQLAELEHDYQVVSVMVPAASSMQDIAEGLAAVLKKEGLEKVHIFGVSFGGLAVQTFLEIYPDRVLDAVLSHTMVPRPDAVGDFERQYRATRLLPRFLYTSVSKAAGMRLLENDIPDVTNDEKAFWKCYYADLYPDKVAKAIFLARVQAGADYQRNVRLTPGGPRGWDGRILIVESALDDYIQEVDRDRIKAHYPQATVHTVTEYGHMGALVRIEPTVGVVRSFLGR